MTDSRWRRLRRGDLIELAIEQKREIEELRQRVAALEEQLAQPSRPVTPPAPAEDAEEKAPLRRPPRLRC